MEAIGVGYVTSVGFMPPFTNRGNCMSLRTTTDEYHALNLRYEPLQMMINAGEIDWPLEIELVTPPKGITCCKVTDKRIPKERLTDDICSGCARVPPVCVGCNKDIKKISVYNNDGGPYCIECARKKKETQ